MATRRYQFDLPWPPSNNAYYRAHRGRKILSSQGRAYAAAVRSILARIGLDPLFGKMGVSITLHPPDRRTRDNDNFFKAPLDAMQKAGLYKNDGDFDDTSMHKGDVSKPGYITVDIWEIGG